MREQFLNFLNELMRANPELARQLMTDDIQAYIDTLSGIKDEKPILTDNGKVVLKYLQENRGVRAWKAKDVADGLGISSRGVSGALRKLVNDGFCEKIGKDPAIYVLTEKGKNFIID